MNRIGIMGAMDPEIKLYLDKMASPRVENAAGFAFHFGELGGCSVVVVKSGVGKVNAGICAQILITKFSVSAVIFTGIAGAINPALGIADIVISKDSVQHDMDGVALNFEKGRIPFSDLRFFAATDHLVKLAISSANAQGLNAVEGRILTGDQFIADNAKKSALREEFAGDCVDMESAAVAHTCIINHVPHVIIRSISDNAGGSAKIDFEKFIHTSSRNSSLIVERMLDSLQSHPLELMKIKAKIRTIPHWPKKGVMFRDITTLLKDKEGFGWTIDALARRYEGKDIDIIAGVDARGLIIGAALADRLKLGFVPIRKAGKLPGEKISEKYNLEYGVDTIEIHSDSIRKGERVLLVDDLLATGGTALAACRLIDSLSGVIVECCFVVDLPDLGGKKRLESAGYSVFNLVEFEGE